MCGGVGNVDNSKSTGVHKKKLNKIIIIGQTRARRFGIELRKKIQNVLCVCRVLCRVGMSQRSGAFIPALYHLVLRRNRRPDQLLLMMMMMMR